MRFGILDKHIEILIAIEHTGIPEFILHLLRRPPLVCFDQVAMGALLLRVLVEILHVGMRRRAVEVKVVFLDIFAVIAFAVGQAEQTFLQDRVSAVPQGKRKTQLLVIITDARQAIFTPTVGAGTRLIMSEIVPRIPVLAIIFPNRTPLSLAQIGSPFLPRDTCLTRSVQAFLLGSFDIIKRRFLAGGVHWFFSFRVAAQELRRLRFFSGGDSEARE